MAAHVNASVVAIAGIAGLPIGSFLTVVVHRVPTGESVVAPGSRCPACGTAIRAVDNVPVLSFLLRRGRCRTCGAAISLRYPATELATALLFSAVASRMPSPWEVPAYCVLVAGLVALGAIDVAHFRLPTPVIVATLAVGAPLLVLASAKTHAWSSLVHAGVAGVACFAAFALLYAAARRAMGYGDVRLAGLCGVFLGWLGYRVALVGVLLGVLAAGAAAVALLASGRAGRKTRLPFGPFLAVGTVAAVLFGPSIARFWLG